MQLHSGMKRLFIRLKIRRLHLLYPFLGSHVCAAGEQEFDPQRRIAFVLAPPHSRARHWTAFAHAPHLRAKMVRLKIHCDAVWLEHCIECIDNLLSQPFLHGKTPGKQPHEARKLGNVAQTTPFLLV